MRGGEELTGGGAGALAAGRERGGGGGIQSESALGGGDAQGVSELTTELVEELSSSSRNAVSLGRFEVGAIISSSSSLSESSVMQSTVLSDEELPLKNIE